MWKQAESNETQKVSVAASGGSFTLSFNEASTAPIAFDAPAASVQSALEALKGVKAGNVSVTGGTGSYVVTFTGDFAGANVAQMSAEDSSLLHGRAPGSRGHQRRQRRLPLRQRSRRAPPALER